MQENEVVTTEHCKYCEERTKCEETTCTAIATIYCHKHNMCFCESCYQKKHPSTVSFLANHKTDRLERGGRLCPAVKCPNHPVHFIDRKCEICKSYTCSDCFLKEHKGHTYKVASELLAEAQATNDSKISDCNDRMAELQRTIDALKQAIDNASKSTRDEEKKINALFDSAKIELENRRKELISEIYSRNDDYKKRLGEEIKKLSAESEETKKSEFHGKRAVINGNMNNVEATLDHYEKVKREMEAAADKASEQYRKSRETKQETYSFKGKDIVGYIKEFGHVDTNESEIPYESVPVNKDEIAKQNDEEFAETINKMFPDIKSVQKGNLSFLPAGPLSIQSPQQEYPQEYPQQNFQSEIPLTTTAPIPQTPITFINKPKVSHNCMEDGTVKVTWEVDPQIKGLDYSVGIYVGGDQVQSVQRGSTSYEFKTELPKGTKIYVATAYNNVGSEYGEIIV